MIHWGVRSTSGRFAKSVIHRGVRSTSGRFARCLFVFVFLCFVRAVCPRQQHGVGAGGVGGIRGRPAVRGKRTYGARPGQRVEEQGTWASRTQNHSEAGYGRPVDRGAWTAKTVKRPRQQPAHPQYANYWAPLTRKRHIPRHIQHSPNTPTTGLRERGNDTSKSTGRSS